jgi:hypothetical protein
MVKDEAILVLEYAYLESQFLGYTGFTLADPFSMRFKNGENFFCMRYLFIQHHSSSNLIDLPLSMTDIFLNGGQS